MAIGQRFYIGGPVSAILIFRDLRAVLNEASGVNASLVDLWIQIHDNTSGNIADGDRPVYSYLVVPKQTFAIDPPGPATDPGRVFTQGIVIAWSTTQDILTQVIAPAGPLYGAGRDLA